MPEIDSTILLAALYEPGTLNRLDLDKTRALLEVNVLGAFNLVAALLPTLQRQGRGQLALCGSVAGYSGLPGGQPYSASKAAIINLAQSLKAENPQLDIKVINPGFVKTPLTDKNSFKMPMMVSAEYAAAAIAAGLQKKSFEIHFPKKFTVMLKCLKILPYWVYFALVKKRAKKGSPDKKERTN